MSMGQGGNLFELVVRCPRAKICRKFTLTMTASLGSSPRQFPLSLLVRYAPCRGDDFIETVKGSFRAALPWTHFND